MCSGSEPGSYLRLIDFVYHSTLGLRVIKKPENRYSLSTINSLDLGTLAFAPLSPPTEREFFIHNLLVRIHFIIVMSRWTGLAPTLFQVAVHLPSYPKAGTRCQPSTHSTSARWPSPPSRPRPTACPSPPLLLRCVGCVCVSVCVREREREAVLGLGFRCEGPRFRVPTSFQSPPLLLR